MKKRNFILLLLAIILSVSCSNEEELCDCVVESIGSARASYDDTNYPAGTEGCYPVCHNGNTLWKKWDAYQAHLGHGDYDGTCEEDTDGNGIPDWEETDDNTLGVNDVQVGEVFKGDCNLDGKKVYNEYGYLIGIIRVLN